MGIIRFPFCKAACIQFIKRWNRKGLLSEKVKEKAWYVMKAYYNSINDYFYKQCVTIIRYYLFPVS